MLYCDNISKTYPKQISGEAKEALKTVSFSLKEGQTLGLVGPNGAGKSTTIRLIMDFIRPDSGNIAIMGQANDLPKLRKNIGYLPEIANFPSNLTCQDMLDFAGATCGMKQSAIRKASEYWLERLELIRDRKRPLRSFSKGMQQRTSFIMALIHEPELFILDEPMSGLDPLGRATIVELIQDLRKQGKTILFCSHILHDVERLTDDILILNRGKILFQGDAESLQDKYHSLEDAFLAKIQDEELACS